MPSSTSHSLNSLVQGTVVEGTVKSESDIRIDGTIKGILHCNAKVIIGPSGRVEGEVQCKNAVIEGQFEGTLNVEALLDVRDTANVTGDISTGKLIVNQPKSFNVTCAMGGGMKKTSSKASSNQNQGKHIGKSTAKAGA